MDQALIVFLKKPEPGKVKTRLAQDIGDQRAADVYSKLLQHHFQWIGRLKATTFAFHDNYSSPPPEVSAAFNHWIPQTDGDLGVRMMNAFETVFQLGHNRAAIIGTDCPAITPKLIQSCFDELEKKPVCFGPSSDGGYYLLGLKEVYPQLFLNMEWSHAEVLGESLSRLSELKLPYHLLEELRDIDFVSDLEYYPEFKPAGL